MAQTAKKKAPTPSTSITKASTKAAPAAATVEVPAEAVIQPKAPKARRAKAAAGPPAAKAKAPAARKSRRRPKAPVSAQRSLTLVDDDDALLSSGAGNGIGFGRCGGRVLHSQLEQTLCDRLTAKGIAHSHTPRHFEVRIEGKGVAAYPPLIVLRGRGREGKTVVLEGSEHLDAPLLVKIAAFRGQYGSEFYITFVAEEELLEQIPLSAYDESCTLRDLNNLISRLAE
jgi:hypothetical protein